MDKLAAFVVHLAEGLFFFGLIGACCVVLLSAVDDARELFGKNKPS